MRSVPEHGQPGELPELRARARVGRLWQDAQWWLIGAAALAAAVLGYVGFREYARATGGSTSFWDLSYRTLQLFTLESGSVDDTAQVPPSLQVARFLAPLVTAGALVRATLGLFKEQAQAVQIGLMRDHVIVCGIGRKGLALARSLREQGYRVVAVERDAEGDTVATCRSAGVPVLIGDAGDPDVLRKANLRHASYLVALCGESGTNAQVTSVAHQLSRRRTRPLTCLVHVVEPGLSSLLRARFPTSGGPQFRVEFFDLYERAARVLLRRHPPFGAGVGSPPHLLVVGFGRLGRAVLVQAARAWRASDQPHDGPLAVTVVDLDPAVDGEDLLAEHPEVAAACQVKYVQEYRQSSGTAVTAAYVCVGDEAQALLAGLTLHRRLAAQGTPVVVRASTDEGLPTLLRTASGGFAGLHGFAVLDQTCDADLLLGGFTESLAQLLHARYVAAREAQGWVYGEARSVEHHTHPALTTWAELDEDLKDSNRDQAAHTWAKLAAVRCELAELTDWDAARFRFDEVETETLAEMEHRRWYDLERRTAARGRSWRRRPHVDLVPWDDLPEQEKDIDREFVRALPGLLAELGYQVVRGAT